MFAHALDWRRLLLISFYSGLVSFIQIAFETGLFHFYPKMRSPIPFSLGLATAFASLSTAHTVLTTLFINDVNQGDGTCIRMAKDGRVCTHPIVGLDTTDMACGKCLPLSHSTSFHH